MKEAFFQDPNSATTFLLIKVVKEWQRLFKKALLAIDLTPAQFGLLGNVLRMQKMGIPITQAMIAKAMNNDVMTTSQLAASLEKKKFIRRVRKVGDARAYAMELTDQGGDVVLRAFPIAERCKAQFLLPLTGRESELNALLRLLITSDTISPNT